MQGGRDMARADVDVEGRSGSSLGSPQLFLASLLFLLSTVATETYFCFTDNV